jgi:hypothetical protein
MLIGGYALPAYGRIRATLDVDMAIDASFSGVVKLHGSLRESGYQLPSSPQPDASLFVLTDLENMVEIEVWTKPDGIVFDEELLRRRVRVRPFNDDFEMFAVGPEDFIVNKLARKDRGVQDEQDVISVLKRRKEKLDYDYLARRAKRADVSGLLETLKAKVA